MNNLHEKKNRQTKSSQQIEKNELNIGAEQYIQSNRVTNQERKSYKVENDQKFHQAYGENQRTKIMIQPQDKYQVRNSKQNITKQIENRLNMLPDQEESLDLNQNGTYNENVFEDESSIADGDYSNNKNNIMHSAHHRPQNSVSHIYPNMLTSYSEKLINQESETPQVIAINPQLISPNIVKFKQVLLKILQKFSKVHTQKQAAEELKIMMTTDITDNERMTMFLVQLSEVNDHMSLSQMKEQIKQFGIAAEIFEEALVPFLPKILQNFQKKIKEETAIKLHQVIGEAIGLIEWHVIGKIEEYSEQILQFERHFQNFSFNIIEKSKNKNVQIGAISCLTKILVNCPDDILFEKLDEITEKMSQIVRNKNFLAHQHYLECLISLIFHIQGEFKNYYQKFLPYLLEQIQQQKDAQTRRVAIDSLYSIGAHLKEEITSHIDQILPILDVCRVDKNQPVRAAAQELIKLLKELYNLKTNQSQLDDEISNDFFQKDLLKDQEFEALNESLSVNKNQIKTEKRARRDKTPVNDNISQNIDMFKEKKLTGKYEIFEDNKIDRLVNKKQNLNQDDVYYAQKSDQNLQNQQIQPYVNKNKDRSGSPLNRKKINLNENKNDSFRIQNDFQPNQLVGTNQQLKDLKQSNISKSQMLSDIEINSSKAMKKDLPLQQSQKMQNLKLNETKKTVNQSIDELQSQKELLRNPQFLKDKSIKKVSIATLKRRMQQNQESLQNQTPVKTNQSKNNQDYKNKQMDDSQDEYDPQYNQVNNKKRFLSKLNPNFLNQFNQNNECIEPKQADQKKKFSQVTKGVELDEDTNQEVDGSITILSSKPPQNIEYLKEIQRQAEIRYQQHQNEEKEKYKGLNIIEKRKKIIEEMSSQQNQKDGNQKNESKVKTPLNKTLNLNKEFEAENKKKNKNKNKFQYKPEWKNILEEDEIEDSAKVSNSPIIIKESKRETEKSNKQENIIQKDNSQSPSKDIYESEYNQSQIIDQFKQNQEINNSSVYNQKKSEKEQNSQIQWISLQNQKNIQPVDQFQEEYQAKEKEELDQQNYLKNIVRGLNLKEQELNQNRLEKSKQKNEDINIQLQKYENQKAQTFINTEGFFSDENFENKNLATLRKQVENLQTEHQQMYQNQELNGKQFENIFYQISQIQTSQVYQQMKHQELERQIQNQQKLIDMLEQQIKSLIIQQTLMNNTQQLKNQFTIPHQFQQPFTFDPSLRNKF